MRGEARGQVRPNTFGIAFGVVGLADLWSSAAPILHTGEVIPDVLDIVAALIWAATGAAYARQGARQVLADLQDRVVAPFVPLSAITGMLLAVALSDHAFEAGRALVVVFLVITIGVGGWMTGQWIVADLDQDAVHPGYFLPTVAGGFVAAYASAAVHLRTLAETSFGIGMLCWLLLGSLLLNRLFFRPTLPPALVPTLAIELAPPAVAGLAYTAMTGGATDTLAYALAGYTVLMALVQLRLVPGYLRLRFGPGFWAFTFAYAAAATDALQWIDRRHPAGSTALAAVVLAGTTALVGAVGVRSVVAIRRGQFFPVGPAAPKSAADTAQQSVSAGH